MKLSPVLLLLAALLILPAAARHPRHPKHAKPHISIMGKWHFVTEKGKDHSDGQSEPYNYKGLETDYMEFRKDGRVYREIFGEKDTLGYRLKLRQRRIILDNETMQIVKLTNKDLIIRYKNKKTDTGYFEGEIVLKK
jgi:hypothetical protein